MSTERGIKLVTADAQGIALFELYEEGGLLLFVTSDPGLIKDLEPGDFIVRRVWATAAEPTLWRTSGGESE